MFSLEQLTGRSIPEKTLCFTFDDGPGETTGEGPGPKTLPLAEYLHAEGISATFFCVGKNIARFPAVTASLHKLGHIVASHTYSHSNMTTLFEGGHELEFLKEMETTDNLIRQIIPGRPIYFRSPYGLWKSRFSKFLNKNMAAAPDYIGPVHWDLGGDDYKFWGNSLSAEDCAKSYLEETELKKKGIILLHDSIADFEQMRLNNRTCETVKIMVPLLKEKGYRFTGLGEFDLVPAPRSIVQRFLRAEAIEIGLKKLRRS